MDSREGLIALRDRVGKLTGPSREVDCLVWAEMDGRDVRWEANMLLARSRRPPHDECLLGDIDPGRVARNFSVASGHRPPVPAYTASVDAVLSLIDRLMPNRNWLLARGRLAPSEPLYGAQIMAGANPVAIAEHDLRPVALLLALLSALPPGDTSNALPTVGLRIGRVEE